MSDINEKSNFVFEFQPVTKLFEEQVRLHPDKCAVASSKESFTYAQLNERANRIANSLIEKGVGCEKIVGVVLERRCDFYAVRQGILKAGGAFAVAAPDYPDDRVQFIFEDAGAPFIITTKEIAKERQELFSRLSCTVLLLEELLANPNTANPDTEIGEHDLCYCIYTSGSTGKPKGVMIEHINLANFVNPNPKNAEIFGFAKRSGGDFPQIIRTTAARISAKIEVEREVDTVIAGKKLEGKIMSVMPFFILAYLNLASGEFIDPLYGNLAGVLVMSAALLVFVGAMAINRRISDIRV